jgi:5-methylcytosine-specific restriction protein A
MSKLIKGDVMDNVSLCKTFLCATQGGMRRSIRTNTLILVSNHVKSIYRDKWHGDILHYTGTGSEGDQSFDFKQNKTLYLSNRNNVDILLFEVLKDKEYTFLGRVELAENPYLEQQPDKNGKTRNVCMFPVKIVDEEYEFFF